ncbi:uncharacterized protein [Dendrobates tinctorius]|uniref:uncharacterized protein n=1 Tax=Dendrobates tinctorius TaxID=92724 RepID=UPI003CCA3339
MRSWSGRIWVLSLMMLAALLQEGQMDETLQNSTSVTLWFDTKAATATFRVDLCQIVKCQWNLKFGKKSSNPNYKYLTGVEGAVVYICVTRPGNENCNSWSDAAWNTGTSWGYKPEEAMTRVSLSGKPLLKRMNIAVPIPKWGCDPEVLDWRFSCNPLLITLDEPSLGDEGLYVLGLYTPGRQVQQGTFWLKAVPAQDKEQEEDKPKRSGEMLDVDGIGELGYEEKLAVETGYTERNEWLLWMKYTTEQNNKTDCIACATARPHLVTIPLRYSEQDQVDLQCILALYNATYDPSDNVLCQSLSVRYPIAKIDQVPPRVYAYPGDYTCFLRTGPGRWVGNLTSEFCHNTIPINTDTGGFKASWFQNQTIARSDIWWLCGDMKLRPRLPPGWVGSCALVQVLMPFKIISSEEIKGGGMNIETLHRNRRSVPAGSFDPRVYIDNIGTRKLDSDSNGLNLLDGFVQIQRKAFYKKATKMKAFFHNVQPLDACLNKPFKDRIREQWNEWMVSGEKSFTKGGNMRTPQLDVLCKFVIKALNDIDAETVIKSFKKCGISNSLAGMEDYYLWQEEEEAEAEPTPSDTEFDPNDDCLTDVSQDVIDVLRISDEEQEDF